jgi:hypothetical protein
MIPEIKEVKTPEDMTWLSFSLSPLTSAAYFTMAAGIPIAATSVMIHRTVEDMRYSPRLLAPRYRPSRIVMQNPSIVEIMDAINVILTSNANFFDSRITITTTDSAVI